MKLTLWLVESIFFSFSQTIAASGNSSLFNWNIFFSQSFILAGCETERKSIQHFACNWESQRPTTFSQELGVFNAGGDLEDAVSPPAGPEKTLNGARAKASKKF